MEEMIWFIQIIVKGKITQRRGGETAGKLETKLEPKWKYKPRSQKFTFCPSVLTPISSRFKKYICSNVISLCRSVCLCSFQFSWPEKAYLSSWRLNHDVKRPQNRTDLPSHWQLFSASCIVKIRVSRILEQTWIIYIYMPRRRFIVQLTLQGRHILETVSLRVTLF